jgi:hypothetical protein
MVVSTLLLLTPATALLSSATAYADQKEACATSYEQAQKLKRDGKLKEAREELVVCGSEKCPALLVPYCVQMLHDVDETMPTVIIVAHGVNGEQVQSVRVLVDGMLVAENLDGRAISLNPGKHHMRYELVGSAPVEEDIIVNEGERSRRLEPSFATRPLAGPVASTGASPIAPHESAHESSGPGKLPGFVMVGIGGAGLIVGGVTGGLAIAAKSSLDKECHTKADCPAFAQKDIDRLNTMGIASTVGFVAGSTVAGIGIILAVALPAHHTDAAATSKTATIAPRVEPWVSPLGGGIRGTF